MAITKKSITTTVQAITTAGNSGSVWMKEGPDGDKGLAEVYIYHTDGETPSAETILDLGKKLLTPGGNDDIMIFSSDNSSDVFYACCKNTGDKADILVDEV